MSPKPTQKPFRLALTLPIPPAGSNHAYKNVTMHSKLGKRFIGRRLTPESEFWRENASLAAQEAMRVSGLELVLREQLSVDCVIFWMDKRSQCDCDGILKLPLDALNGIVYSSDKFVLPRVLSTGYDAENPRIEMTISCPPTKFMEIA